jgi:hypothetical protein
MKGASHNLFMALAQVANRDRPAIAHANLQADGTIVFSFGIVSREAS